MCSSDPFLSTCDLDFPLNGLLPHADTLCILRYNSQEDAVEDQAVKLTYGGKEEEDTQLCLAVLPPRLPDTGSTDASTGSLPVTSCQTRSIAATIAEVITGTTGWTTPVVPALRERRLATPRARPDASSSRTTGCTG